MYFSILILVFQMGLIRHYLRVFFRTHFKPISPEIAKKWEINSAVLYFLFAWTACGLSIYYVKNNVYNKDSVYSSGVAFTPYGSMKKFAQFNTDTTFIHIKGFNHVETEVLSLDEIHQKT
ncbi:hypothetical protein CEXT_549191 [Caerostris extrusa]|uniref:Uncharacterized protein n=1 Tax=Caerostris extrusa TaxID=172846 RepID=A0AAV4PW62_CAEEX|nr:hypothetical protein CEXT_549191 [Caerostris extrusa]